MFFFSLSPFINRDVASFYILCSRYNIT